MRTLNRPMFNMGGPIKEGVMHGIREPYRGGQLVRPGPGRQGYQGSIGTGINAARWLATLAGKTFGNVGRTYNIGKIGGAGVRGAGEMGAGHLGTGRALATIPKPSWGARIAEKWKATPSWFRSSVERDPVVKLGKAAYEGRGLLGTPIKWTAKQLATPTGALGLLYVGGKWLWPDGTEASTDEIKQNKAQHGPFDHSDKKKIKKAQDAFAEAQRDTRVKKYLDMMGYDRSKKTAVADALIDASKIVSDRGTLEKKNITRDLINPIIQATSKRFDKPEQIREAVGLMSVKAAITKDLEDPQVKKLRALQITDAEQKIAESESFEGGLRKFISDRKGAVDKPTLERIARLLANQHGDSFTVIEDVTAIPEGGTGIYMSGSDIYRVIDGNAQQIA